MQVKIFATCNGLEKIYPGQRETKFNDIRTSDKKGELGDKCYSISLKENGVQYSKFNDVRDLALSNRKGFMRILIELNYNEFNNGQNVFELLNRIHDLFKSQFIDDHNRVDLESFYNNTDVLESMISGFSFTESPSRFGSTIIKQRSNKNGHFYYKSTEELIRIFDQPKQDEFLAFDTIYFISEDERAHDVNPLHQFINYDETTGTDLTNVVDLNNVEYQIIGDSSLNFKIKVHTPSGISEKHLGDFIRLKDNITIIFSKQYYNDVMKSGSLAETNFGKYLKIDHSRKIVEVEDAPDFTSPIIKEIQLQCLNVVTNKIIQPALELEFKSNGQAKYNKKSSTINFSGEELNMTWNVNLLDNSKYKLHKSYISLTPLNNSKLVVELFEFKSIKFQFKDDKGKKLNDEDVQIINPLNKRHIDYQKNIVTFEGAELNRKHNIEFKYKDGYRLSQSNVFLPASCSDIVALSFERYTKAELPKDEKKWIKYAAISFLCLVILTPVFLYEIIPASNIWHRIKSINTGATGTGATGTGATGAGATGAGATGAVASGAVASGAGEKGAGEKGAGATGAGEKGAGETGAGATGAGASGAGASGAGASGAGATGAGATGAGATGAGATGAGAKGAGAKGAGETGAGATGAGATGAGATGAGAKGAGETGAGANVNKKKENNNSSSETTNSVYSIDVLKKEAKEIGNYNKILENINVVSDKTKKEKLIKSLNKLQGLGFFEPGKTKKAQDSILIKIN